jgi:hypothetical protein
MDKFDKFIDKLCQKRLCLSSNIDIQLLRSGILKSNINCLCACSQHIACTFDTNNPCLKCS